MLLTAHLACVILVNQLTIKHAKFPWTSTRLCDSGNYPQLGVHLCCVSQSQASAAGWIIWVYRLEKQCWGAEGREGVGGGAKRKGHVDTAEQRWCSVQVRKNEERRMLSEPKKLFWTFFWNRFFFFLWLWTVLMTSCGLSLHNLWCCLGHSKV